MAQQLTLALAALAGAALQWHPAAAPPPLLTQPFEADALEYHFPTPVAAKLAIAADVGPPLPTLPPDDRAFIEQVLAETRRRRLVLPRVREHCRAPPLGEGRAG